MTTAKKPSATEPVVIAPEPIPSTHFHGLATSEEIAALSAKFDTVYQYLTTRLDRIDGFVSSTDTWIRATDMRLEMLKDASITQEKMLIDLAARVEVIVTGLKMVADQQQWVTDNAAAARENLEQMLSSGGGIGGMLKMAMGALGGSKKQRNQIVDMPNIPEGPINGE